MKVLSAIITYNPDIEDLRLDIAAVLPQVDKLVIFDNASKNVEEVVSLAEEYKIEAVRFEKNMGIAYALQAGLEKAKEAGFELYLTMDQDSMFASSDAVANMKECFTLYENAAIVAPVWSRPPVEIDLSKPKFEKTVREITSGALCKVDMLCEVGGFNVELFIDEVDIEICFRLQRNGKEVYKCNHAALEHKLAEVYARTLLGKRRNILTHSAFRWYYISRNYTYMYREFKEFRYLKGSLTRFYIIGFLNIILTTKSRESLRALRKGHSDGKKFTTKFALYAKGKGKYKVRNDSSNI